LRDAVTGLKGSDQAEALKPKVSVIPTIVEKAEGSARFDGEVLFVGRLVKVKGVELLIDAMRLLPGARLVVVGDGPERAALERSAAGLKVKFEGMLPHDEVRAHFGRSAVLVQPSLAEGMPNTGREAMAHGLPVVATAVAGVPEIVVDGETGFLIVDRDAQVLASRIDTLLKEKATWERMSEACRALALDYSPDRVLPRLEEVLDNMSPPPSS
jgi:glycosyltransferase involved in cell wall biosynthesis